MKANELPSWNEVLCIHGSLGGNSYGKGREWYSLSSFHKLFSVLSTFVKNLYKWLSSSITPEAGYSTREVILSAIGTSFASSTAYLRPTSLEVSECPFQSSKYFTYLRLLRYVWNVNERCRIKQFRYFVLSINTTVLNFFHDADPFSSHYFHTAPQVFSNVKLLENKLNTYLEPSYKLS